ncbi:YciI family protein [Cellulomonas sp. McL0617]|uniref:YciI family protein n=1 Tax=Cellulomonas sp. McL0617 TaxID=3415675 RepID=UPI003CE7DCE3
MLLMRYHVEGVPPIDTWAPEDLVRHIQFQRDLDASLVASGELVGAEGLAWPDDAKLVRSDGAQPPVVTDGPFAESKEFLAGFWTVDVESEARAIEIAALASAAPGPAGVPIQQVIEVRAVMEAPDVAE